jgi:hypothetical protein
MSELDIFKPGFHVRMMQFGDADGGWAIPFQEWKGLVRGAFDWISESRTQHVWHNGFGFDAQALRQEGIIIDPSVMQDTQIWAGLGGFAGESRGLKQLARKELGDFGAKTAIGADRLHNGMKQAGWTWTTVPMGWKPYPLYGVMDTMATARLYEKWAPWRKQFAYHHDMEIAVSVITNQMARTGMVVDGEYKPGGRAAGPQSRWRAGRDQADRWRPGIDRQEAAPKRGPPAGTAPAEVHEGPTHAEGLPGEAPAHDRWGDVPAGDPPLDLEHGCQNRPHVGVEPSAAAAPGGGHHRSPGVPSGQS